MCLKLIVQIYYRKLWNTALKPLYLEITEKLLQRSWPKPAEDHLVTIWNYCLGSYGYESRTEGIFPCSGLPCFTKCPLEKMWNWLLVIEQYSLIKSPYGLINVYKLSTIFTLHTSSQTPLQKKSYLHSTDCLTRLGSVLFVLLHNW